MSTSQTILSRENRLAREAQQRAHKLRQQLEAEKASGEEQLQRIAALKAQLDAAEAAATRHSNRAYDILEGPLYALMNQPA